MGMKKNSDEQAAKSQISDRITVLGIPAQERTASVVLAVSALYEKIEDLTHELKRTREHLSELEQLVDVDCVAPVPNRRAFLRRLAWVLSMHERYGHSCSVLYFDINNFKQINDTYGHAAGDMTIRHVSQLFLDGLRESDFMARLGGDEFAIIMYYASYESALERGRKLAALVGRTPFLWGTHSVHVSVAYGAYQITRGDDAEGAMAKADAAMYQDKKRMKERATDMSA